jgi:hypothetical protein
MITGLLSSDHGTIPCGEKMYLQHNASSLLLFEGIRYKQALI